MALRMRPRLLALLFGGYFAGVAIGAYYYAATASRSAWYVGFPAFALYSATLVGSLVLLVGLGLILATAARARPAPAPGMDAAALRARFAVLQSHVEEAEHRNLREAVDDLDELLDALTDPLEETPTDLKEAPTEAEVRALKAELAAVGAALEDAEAAKHAPLRPLVLAALGPGVVATVYLGISAMMLPGIEGFAASSYVLSNALILTIAYGWIGLAAYALASFLLLVREAVPKGAGPVAVPTGESVEGL